MARAAGDRYFEATALNNAAQIHRNQGRFEEALQVMMSIVEFVRTMTPTADPGAPARTVRNKLRLAKGPNRLWQHPYYWSAFVLVGDGG